MHITLISAAHSLGGGGEKIAIDPWRLFRQHHPGLGQEDGQLVSSINIHNVLTLAPRYYLASPASAPGEQHVYQVFSVCSFFSGCLVQAENKVNRRMAVSKTIQVEIAIASLPLKWNRPIVMGTTTEPPPTVYPVW